MNFELIPDEVLLAEVLLRLNFKGLQALSQTNKWFSNLCKSEMLWEKKIKLDFPNKFHLYFVWNEIYLQDLRNFYVFWRECGIPRGIQDIITISEFRYVVVNFSKIPVVEKSELLKLYDDAYFYQDILFCGIKTVDTVRIYKDYMFPKPEDYDEEPARNLRCAGFTMRLISDLKFNGFVFYSDFDITIGNAMALIKFFKIMYPGVNVGDITQMRVEPVTRVLCIDVHV